MKIFGKSGVTEPAGGPGGTEAPYGYDANLERTEILWKCLRCGELKPRNHWVLGDCPARGAPKSQFVLVDED
jgi:hypothetical protein